MPQCGRLVVVQPQQNGHLGVEGLGFAEGALIVGGLLEQRSEERCQGCVLPAKSTRIAMYCMGADVELSLSLKPMSSGNKAKSVVGRVKVALDELDPLDHVRDGGDAAGRFGGDDAEETGIKEEDDMYSMDMDLAAVTETDPPKPSSTSRTNHSLGGPPLRRNEAAKDPLFVTLVHGDMLLLEGDDFEVCPSCSMPARRYLQRFLSIR